MQNFNMVDPLRFPNFSLATESDFEREWRTKISILEKNIVEPSSVFHLISVVKVIKNVKHWLLSFGIIDEKKL